MKILYTLLIFSIYLLIGCRKSDSTKLNSSINNRFEILKDKVKETAAINVSIEKLNSYNWELTKEIKLKNDSIIIIVPNKVNSNKFLIATNKSTSLDINQIEIENQANNTIKISNRSLINNSLVINYFINGKFCKLDNNIKSNSNSKTKSFVSGDMTLPDVVVTAYLPSDYSYIDFLSLYWLFNQNPLYINLYIPSLATTTGIQYFLNYQIAYEIEFDDRLTRNRINLQKLKNCLDAFVPTNGASYKVELCSDIPVDDHPEWNVLGNKPGHAFLQVTKTNGLYSATRSFGFYPKDLNLNTITNSIESTILEDNYHEYNAKISMELSETQYNNLMNYSINLSNTKSQYNIFNYNCVNFALDCFNSVRPSGTKISAPLVGNEIGIGVRTPASLFINLRNIKNSNTGNESSNITINTGYSNPSSGECN